MKPRLSQPTRARLADRAARVLDRLVAEGERNPHRLVLNPFASGYARYLTDTRPASRPPARNPLR